MLESQHPRDRVFGWVPLRLGPCESLCQMAVAQLDHLLAIGSDVMVAVITGFLLHDMIGQMLIADLLAMNERVVLKTRSVIVTLRFCSGTHRARHGLTMSTR